VKVFIIFHIRQILKKLEETMPLEELPGENIFEMSNKAVREKRYMR